MKYLKYIKEVFNQYDYYVTITYDEYDGLVNKNNKEVFNKREVDFINNNTNIEYWIKKNKVIKGFKSTAEFDESHMVVLYTNNIRTFINKLEDSYYAVSYYNDNLEKGFYKCDQFEGLVQLLKDKGII